MTTTRYGIPCPTRLTHLLELLPAQAPIRLACLKTSSRDGYDYTFPPQHCYATDKEQRSTFIEKFWQTVSPHLTHETVCIIRQHGGQTVLQLNI